MSVVLTSNDVAVWLRFQIAAGRLTESSDAQTRVTLAQKLGVNISTVSAAFEELGTPNTGTGGASGTTQFCGKFGVVADLVDQIVALEVSDADNSSDF